MANLINIIDEAEKKRVIEELSGYFWHKDLEQFKTTSLPMTLELDAEYLYVFCGEQKEDNPISLSEFIDWLDL